MQLESLSVPFISVEDLPVDLSKDFDIVVDAMFGFSFQGNYYYSFLVHLFLPIFIVKGTLILLELFSMCIFKKFEHEKLNF